MNFKLLSMFILTSFSFSASAARQLENNQLPPKKRYTRQLPVKDSAVLGQKRKRHLDAFSKNKAVSYLSPLQMTFLHNIDRLFEIYPEDNENLFLSLKFAAEDRLTSSIHSLEGSSVVPTHISQILKLFSNLEDRKKSKNCLFQFLLAPFEYETTLSLESPENQALYSAKFWKQDWPHFMANLYTENHKIQIPENSVSSTYQVKGIKVLHELLNDIVNS